MSEVEDEGVAAELIEEEDEGEGRIKGLWEGSGGCREGECREGGTTVGIAVVETGTTVGTEVEVGTAGTVVEEGTTV